MLGGDSQFFLCKFKDFLKLWALKSWYCLGLKSFLKQISLKGDMHYCIDRKVPIFCECLLHKSKLKLQKILKIYIRSFVNLHSGVKRIHNSSLYVSIARMLKIKTKRIYLNVT
jgi:hypothetical protein